jgi:AcrR family transcriptional regulator
VKVSEPTSKERLRILDAFISLVAERGYDETSAAVTAERAGLEEAAFRRHFTDREDCFVAAWEHLTELCVKEVLVAYQSKDTWREQIRIVGLAVIAYLTEHPEHARVLTASAPGPRAWAILDRNIEAFAGLIDLGRQEMDDPESLTRATAEGLAGAVHGQLIQRVSRSELETLRELVGPMMYMVVRPYLGDEVALEELRRS